MSAPAVTDDTATHAVGTAAASASRLPVRSTHARRPATASAPAGSMIERVSSKTSLMASSALATTLFIG